MNKESNEELIARLMRAPLRSMSDAEALNSVGMLIDVAVDVRDAAALTRAFVQLRGIERRRLSAVDQTLVHYFRANAWHGRRLISASPRARAWEQPERQEEILELFRACHHVGFDLLEPVRRCQILTNLGLQFLEVGRFVEAIELWDIALGLIPKFAMALGSRGTGFKHYGLAVEDGYDRAALLTTAQRSFAAAIARSAFWDGPYPPEVKETFRTATQKIAERYDVDAIEADLARDQTPLGRGKIEKTYRLWCLRHRLFVNPLNDIAPTPLAAADTLMLPSLSVSIEDTGIPAIIGFYNQMKQEFAFARLQLFEAMHAEGVHFADRRVRLHNTLDYPVYSMAIERSRTAFRLAYGLLDKVGYFINHYWDLGTPGHRVGFRSVWYKDGDAEQGLHPRFHEYENWPLNGLFWLSKDLFDDHFQKVTSPDAREIFLLRNSLEHKYLQIRHGWIKDIIDEPSTEGLGQSILSDAFEAKTLRILKTARAALIHLALAVHREEKIKQNGREGGLILQMALTPFDDNQKRPM